MVSQLDLETAIRSKVNSISALVVSDVSGGCGQAYDVIIVSEVFEGLNTLKRHRLINDLLKVEIAQLHAFSQKTYTPKQYADMSTTPSVAQAAPAPSATTLSSDAARRPATLDTSTAQRGARVHHRSTSSNISIPELILTTDSNDTAGKAALNAPRPLTPGDHPGGSTQFPDMGAGLSSPGGSSGSGISRLQYNNITNVEFWNGLRDYLESRFMKEDGSASPSQGLRRLLAIAESPPKR
ncbi:hypothetical protein CBS101457_000629 [Exobasidium rhododendri]|nr:hypothetical protein CBS101457_000629 [Exobasidium rhododendri]